jgi:hypothetical protein
MIYLIDPTPTLDRKCPNKCKTLCPSLCINLCGIKPLYGVDTF